MHNSDEGFDFRCVINVQNEEAIEMVNQSKPFKETNNSPK
jgi:hypothetical protein